MCAFDPLTLADYQKLRQRLYAGRRRRLLRHPAVDEGISGAMGTAEFAANAATAALEMNNFSEEFLYTHYPARFTAKYSDRLKEINLAQESLCNPEVCASRESGRGSEAARAHHDVPQLTELHWCRNRQAEPPAIEWFAQSPKGAVLTGP